MPSSVIRSFDYDPVEHRLDIRFVSGRLYSYLDVPERVAAAMRRAAEGGDVPALLHQLHRVGGALQVLGERTAGERCLRLRASIAHGGRPGVGPAVETLLRAIDAIVANGPTHRPG